MVNVKLLLTNKIYRWAKLQLFKESFRFKIISIPWIKKIILWYKARETYKSISHLDSWDQYVAVREMEDNLDKKYFVSKLSCLALCMSAKDTDDILFQTLKSDILSTEIINDTELKDFRDWLIRIDSSEKDYSPISAIIDSFTSAS